MRRNPGGSALQDYASGCSVSASGCTAVFVSLAVMPKPNSDKKTSASSALSSTQISYFYSSTDRTSVETSNSCPGSVSCMDR